jgi:ADP-heptose:LPS heptosyltransferase
MARAAKILILRFSSIGDIVLTTPVVRCLKKQMPGAELHYATKKAFATLLESNPYIDKRHYLDGSLWRLIGQLRAERFDYVIDLHHNLRTAIIKNALGVPAYSFDKLNWQKWLMVRWKVNMLPNRHIVDRYMETLAPLHIRNDGRGLDYFIPYRDVVERDWLPESHQRGFVAFAIGGQHATKKLPLPRLIELCLKINHPIILLGGKEDAIIGEAIEQAVGNQRVYNACGKYNLNQSASVLDQARVVFCHDTGLMHIAAALQKKIYSIWGNTTPLFGMYPYKTTFQILENNGVGCRPCSKIGHDRCPLGHFKCMNELSFDFDIKELRQWKNA